MSRFNHLLEAYIEGTISKVEQDELFVMLASEQYDKDISSQLDLDIKNKFLTAGADLPPHIAQEIVRKIMASEKQAQDLMPVAINRRRIFYRFAAAASIVILFLITALYVLQYSGKGFSSMIPENLAHQRNNSGKVQNYNLPDGSTVRLQPGSTIHYAPSFTKNQREVFLEGDAYFDVTSDRERPFLVYCNDIITRVLGTSFTVETNARTGNVEVAVMKGKVQVISNEDFDRINSPIAPGIIVTPNQKAVYKQQSASFEATLVDQPVVLTGKDVEEGAYPVSVPDFIYEREKLSEVYNELETSFGIEIVPENDNLQDCVFTGDVSEQNLYDKLKIICISTGSTFEINGTRILIRGKGCN